jgi:hypothetical protein
MFTGGMSQGILNAMTAEQTQAQQKQVMAERAQQMQMQQMALDNARAQSQREQQMRQNLALSQGGSGPQPPAPGQPSVPMASPQQQSAPPPAQPGPPPGVAPGMGMRPPQGGPAVAMGGPPPPAQPQKPQIPPYQTVDSMQKQQAMPQQAPGAPPPIQAQAAPADPAKMLFNGPSALDTALQNMKANGVPFDQQLEAISSPQFQSFLSAKDKDRVAELAVQKEAREAAAQAGEQTYKTGMLKLQNRQADETAVRDKNSNAYQMGELGIQGQRLALEKQKAAGVPMSDDSKASIAAQVASGQPINQIVSGYDRKAKEQAREAGIKKIMQDTGMSAEQAGLELANRSISYQSGKKSEAQLTTMKGATKQAVDQLKYNIDQVQDDFKKIGSSDISPVINAIARGEEKWTGDPAYSSLFYHMHATAAESARILSGGQASVAQLHQGTMEEASKWANINMTPKSFNEGVGPAMVSEGEARLKTYEDAVKYQKSGGAGDSDTPKKGPSAGTVEGGYKFKGGDPSDKNNWVKQ